MSNLTEWADEFNGVGLMVESTAFILSLALAWFLSLLAGRSLRRDSVWLGRRIYDGLLFPMLLLVCVWGARFVVSHWQHVLLLKMLVPMLVSLAVIRLSVLVLSAVFPSSALVKLVEQFVSWVAWLAAIFWVLGWLQPLMTELENISFSIGKSQLSLRTLIEGVLTSGFMLVVTLWVSSAIENRILQETVDDLSIRKIVSNATRAVLLSVGFLFAMSTVGVDLTALSVLGGAVGVGLGFGLQKLAANYVSGFVILFERSLRIGDVVKVDGFQGTVKDIKTRYTVIRSLQGRESIVPNEKLITERVENTTQEDPRIMISTSLIVDFNTDVNWMLDHLPEVAANCPRVVADPKPSAMLSAFTLDGLEFTLNFWIADPVNGQMNVKSDVNLAVWRLLNDSGVKLVTRNNAIC